MSIYQNRIRARNLCGAIIAIILLGIMGFLLLRERISPEDTPGPIAAPVNYRALPKTYPNAVLRINYSPETGNVHSIIPVKGGNHFRRSFHYGGNPVYSFDWSFVQRKAGEDIYNCELTVWANGKSEATKMFIKYSGIPISII